MVFVLLLLFSNLKKQTILTLLTFPNFLIFLVNVTLLYYNATEGEGFDSVGFYLNGCIIVTSSGNTCFFLGGGGVRRGRFVGLLSMSLQNSHQQV